jgi:ABC-type Zn uptake system ZnuABC Zn-binding protein ZnuA
MTQGKLSKFFYALFATFFALQGAPLPALAGDQPRLVATLSILADWVKNVAGEDAQVFSLIGPNGDPHQFEPSPSVLRALASADVVFKIGLGLEPWLESAMRSSAARAQIIEVSAGVPVIPLSHHEHGEGCLHKHGEFDPHIWQNPRNAAHAVKRIRDTLVKLFPQKAEIYRRNSDAYIAALRKLDRELESKFVAIPAERRVLVTNHHSMGYFAQRYGFRLAGNVLNSPSTETGEPSPMEIARLAKLIREQKIAAIFSENTSGNRLAALVAREAGVPHVEGLLSDALGTTPGTDSYIGMMRHNAALIVEALSR